MVVLQKKIEWEKVSQNLNLKFESFYQAEFWIE